MTCINNKKDYLNNIDKNDNHNPIRKICITRKRNRNKNDIKLFLYNKNYDTYNNIMNINYPNIYKVKFLNENNKKKDNIILSKYDLSSLPKQDISKDSFIEDDDYFNELIKKKQNNRQPLERRKQSISGKIYEKEYYQEGSDKKRIIKSKYVEILPEKKDSIRAKLVKLNYSSRKSQSNNKYDFYGENCSFLNKNINTFDNDADDECLYQDKEFVSEVKRRNRIYKNNNNNILFLNTSLFKKKIDDVHEKENPSLMKVDELDINKTEKKNWKQNILKKQLETLNEVNDKAQVSKYRKAESLENIDKNDYKYREILSTNSKLSYNDDIFDDEKITIFKNFNIENNDNEIFDNENKYSVSEIKSREINFDRSINGLNIDPIIYRNSFNERPSLVNHLYHHKQSKEIFNISNKPIERTITNRKVYSDKKNDNKTLLNINSRDYIENHESDIDSIDEFLLDIDMENNISKLKDLSLKNRSEDCIDKMLMNYHDDIHQSKIRFNLGSENTIDEKQKNLELQSVPSTPDSKKGQRGKSPKTSSGKTPNQKIPSQKSTKKSNNNIITETNDKKHNNNVIINLPDQHSDNIELSSNNNSNINKTVEIPLATPNKSGILDLDLLKPIKNKEIEYIINLNDSIPFKEKLISFRYFQLEVNKLIKKLKEAEDKKKKEEILRKKKEEDMELINLLKRIHDEHQQDTVIIQEQEASKKGYKKIKRIPSDTQDKKGNSILSPNNNNLTVNSNSNGNEKGEKGLSINSVFHITMLVSNIKNQISNKAKECNDNVNNKNAAAIEKEDEEETLNKYYLKLIEAKKKLQLEEKNLAVLKQYDENLKEKLKNKIKQNILQYEVLNIKKYYKSKDTINIYNMSSKHSNKVESKIFKNISNTGSLIDFKTINKINSSLHNSLAKPSYNDYIIKASKKGDNKAINSNNSNSINNNKNNDSDKSNDIENSLLNSDFYKIFSKSHPSKFKNPIEQVKTVSDVTLPTIADYKNKVYYHNHRVIDLNKVESNLISNSKNRDNNNRIGIYYLSILYIINNKNILIFFFILF
ncbi:hypothetical protein BCR36DRAFT_282798 [Piromyces finnis]|uniref:Uncharacterized protein n=1 Tax=Piromyces finnis TaxID=1754191 RepID=A0A1Y1VF38_9FUNG|nr:hypothetical protein BCR36DRAFT_282798 [Piromyces finnis]|eukprot:ORX54725.1 hypothetical protein BCR36DRAFT_282798 [Piromyces finnis]